MRKQAGYFTLLLLCFTFSVSANNHVDEYISNYKDIAQREMQRSKIPASIILAQGIHESSWGRGELAVNSRNHFGIKCKDYWTGPTYYIEDDDYKNGKLIKSCFRAYDDEESSYIDHTDFLVDNERYQGLFMYDHTDYKNWARGLKQCGYATDKKYAEKLIRIIETHQLYLFDLMPVLILEAPTYVIPQQFLQNNEIADPVVYHYEEIVNETMDPMEVQEDNSIAEATEFNYEIQEPAILIEETPVFEEESMAFVQSEEPIKELPVQNYDQHDLTAVIPNRSSGDKKIKNLGRKPRMSSSAGPR